MQLCIVAAGRLAIRNKIQYEDKIFIVKDNTERSVFSKIWQCNFNYCIYRWPEGPSTWLSDFYIFPQPYNNGFDFCIVFIISFSFSFLDFAIYCLEHYNSSSAFIPAIEPVTLDVIRNKPISKLISKCKQATHCSQFIFQAIAINCKRIIYNLFLEIKYIGIKQANYYHTTELLIYSNECFLACIHVILGD